MSVVLIFFMIISLNGISSDVLSSLMLKKANGKTKQGEGGRNGDVNAGYGWEEEDNIGITIVPSNYRHRRHECQGHSSSSTSCSPSWGYFNVIKTNATCNCIGIKYIWEEKEV